MTQRAKKAENSRLISPAKRQHNESTCRHGVILGEKDAISSQTDPSLAAHSHFQSLIALWLSPDQSGPPSLCAVPLLRTSLLASSRHTPSTLAIRPLSRRTSRPTQSLASRRNFSPDFGLRGLASFQVLSRRGNTVNQGWKRGMLERQWEKPLACSFQEVFESQTVLDCGRGSRLLLYSSGLYSGSRGLAQLRDCVLE